jgi:hypothetical protein
MQRPTSLTIIGWLLIVFAVFGVISQLTMQGNPIAQKMLAESPLPASAHMALGIVGAIVSAVSGYGILKGLNWSRFLYIGWSILGFAISFLTVPFTSILLLGVLTLAIFAFFLFRPAANAWFTGGAATVNE